MALPTAPLGALGNMSMPYSIPTVEKGPSILEKAIAAFLVNAAGGVAQRGTENLMSRDYAKEFGEDPAKGFGRLLGPKVGEEDAIRRRAEATRASEATTQRGFVADQAELDRMSRSGENDVNAANRRLLQSDENENVLMRDETAALNALIRGDRGEAAATERNTADNAAMLERERLGNEARANLPSEQINRVIMERLRSSTGLGGTPTTSNTTPNSSVQIDPTVADFAKSTSTLGQNAVGSDVAELMNLLGSTGIGTSVPITNTPQSAPVRPRSAPLPAANITTPNFSEVRARPGHEVGPMDTPMALLQDLIYNISRGGDISANAIDNFLGIPKDNPYRQNR